MRVSSHFSPAASGARKLALASGLVAAVLGILVLAGWHLGSVTLVRAGAGFAPMQYLSGLCFLCAGAGLAAFAGGLPRAATLFSGGVAGAVGLLVSLEYAFGWNLGMRWPLEWFPSLPGLSPQRSSPSTAAGFALAGTAVFLLGLRGKAAFTRLGVWVLGSSALALCLAAMGAYRLGLTGTLVAGTPISMAPHTAVGFLVLSVGLLATQWDGRQRVREDRWLWLPVGVGTAAAVLMLWQALLAERNVAVGRQAEMISRDLALDTKEELEASVRGLELIRLRWERRGGSPEAEWRAEAADLVKDAPLLSAVGRTDGAWRTLWMAPTAAGTGNGAGTGLAGGAVPVDFHLENRWAAEEALARSLAQRKPVVSPTIDFDRNTQGFMAAVPLQVRGNFDGFVFGVFHLRDLTAYSTDWKMLDGWRMSIFENGVSLFGPHHSEGELERVRGETEIEFSGHRLRFVVEPAEVMAVASGNLPELLLGLGLLLSVTASLAVLAVLAAQKARERSRRVRQQNGELLGKIREREEAELLLQESRERLRQVLDSAIGVLVVTTDLNGVITYFSKGAEIFTGYTAGEMVGIHTPAILHVPEEVEKRAAELSKELGRDVHGFEIFTTLPLTKGRERREWTFVRKDGTLRSADLSTSMLGGRNGAAGFVGTAVDITERKNMERQLRGMLRSNNASRTLLECACRIGRLGHWELSMDTMTPFWSDTLYQIHGVTPGTPVTMDFAMSFFHPDDRPKLQAQVEHSVRTGEVYDFEGRMITAQGQTLRVHVRGEPVKDDLGNLSALRGVVQDVTERYEAAEQLRQQNAELARAKGLAEAHARAKTEFLANMSHEIRTPLNAVIGMSELLMDGQLEERERELVETIHSSGDVLLSLINDILDFSKIESGQLDLERIPVNVRDCVESVMDLLAGHAARKNLDLMGWVDPAVPEAVLGDPTRLRQVLVNLTSNAIKFTASGEIFVKLFVDSDGTAEGSGGRWLHAAVRDSGIGIPEERMDRLFNVFSQVDASTTRKFGGTGLGLAISRRLIENMGGRIWAESTEGQGSTFHFAVPLIPAPASAFGGTSAGAAPRSLEGKRVLIVDDNATNRWILEMQAESWLMRPVCMENGPAALDRLRSGEVFDLVIIDVMMPEMDGYVLAAEIRKLRSETELPILMLSSMGDLQHDRAALGLAGILTKPVKAGPLYHAVRLALSVQQAPATEAAPAVEEKPAVLRPLRILVAEDNAVNQRVLGLHLQRMGYRPVMVANGLEVLQAVQMARYEVILLDVQMPEMDGLEAARELCRRYQAAHRPWMIALTANALGSDREDCLAAGMDDYLSKPVRSDNLQSALQQAWEQRHLPQS